MQYDFCTKIAMVAYPASTTIEHSGSGRRGSENKVPCVMKEAAACSTDRVSPPSAGLRHAPARGGGARRKDQKRKCVGCERTGGADARLKFVLFEHELVAHVLHVRQVEIRLGQQQPRARRVDLHQPHTHQSIRQGSALGAGGGGGRTWSTWAKRPSQMAFCASQSTTKPCGAGRRVRSTPWGWAGARSGRTFSKGRREVSEAKSRQAASSCPMYVARSPLERTTAFVMIRGLLCYRPYSIEHGAIWARCVGRGRTWAHLRRVRRRRI